LDIQYNRNEETKTVKVAKTSRTQNGDIAETHSDSSNGKEDEKMEANTADVDSTIDDEELLDLNDDNEIETTVIFLPNVWSLMPNSIEYQKIVDAYKNYIENPPDEEASTQKQESKQTEQSSDKAQADPNSLAKESTDATQAGAGTVDAIDASKSIKALIYLI
jgi:hypothetical protein